jgi:protein SCO1/2
VYKISKIIILFLLLQIPILFNCSRENSLNSVTLLEFTDHHGRLFTFKDMESKNIILYFGFSNCPDKCPVALSILSKVLVELKENNIYGIFISIDPLRDDPQKLRRFINSNPNLNLIALTGSGNNIQKIGEEFGITSIRKDYSQNSYFFDHTNQIIFVDRNFQILGRFPGNISTDTLKGEAKRLFQLK